MKVTDAEFREIQLEYSQIQRVGFRVQLICIKCGAKFDVDDMKLAFQHKEMCDMVVR